MFLPDPRKVRNFETAGRETLCTGTRVGIRPSLLDLFCSMKRLSPNARAGVPTLDGRLYVRGSSHVRPRAFVELCSQQHVRNG